MRCQSQAERFYSAFPPTDHAPTLAHGRATKHLIPERQTERIRHGTALKKGYEAARTSANSKIAGMSCSLRSILSSNLMAPMLSNKPFDRIIGAKRHREDPRAV